MIITTPTLAHLPNRRISGYLPVAFWLPSHCNANFKFANNSQLRTKLQFAKYSGCLSGLIVSTLVHLTLELPQSIARATECLTPILFGRRLVHACANRRPFCGLAASSRYQCIPLSLGYPQGRMVKIGIEVYPLYVTMAAALGCSAWAIGNKWFKGS
jgi:hypothetical protein